MTVRHEPLETPSWDTKVQCECGEKFANWMAFYRHRGDAYLAENERHQRANLLRIVLDGYDRLDEFIIDAINANEFDRVPWLVAQKAVEENKRLRAPTQPRPPTRESDVTTFVRLVRRAGMTGALRCAGARLAYLLRRSKPVEAVIWPAAGHPHYTSTYCIHEDHGECRLACKTCGASCLCPCHPEGE